jgi:hypothetical protein
MALQQRCAVVLHVSRLSGARIAIVGFSRNSDGGLQDVLSDAVIAYE